nr:hypothetical protein [uncultured Rhodococcus sp.]
MNTWRDGSAYRANGRRIGRFDIQREPRTVENDGEPRERDFGGEPG